MSVCVCPSTEPLSTRQPPPHVSFQAQKSDGDAKPVADAKRPMMCTSAIVTDFEYGSIRPIY
jgi:hypothetical protein